jgi:cytochrome c biogenesis protein ResB
MGKHSSEEQRPSAQALSPVLRFLARMDVAAMLILLVLFLGIVGSCFPQQPTSATADPEDLTRWRNSVRARYGGATGLLRAAGVFRWFDSPVFWLALGLLMLAVLVCTVRRWRGVWRRALRRPVRCSDAKFSRAVHVAEVQVPSRPGLPGVVSEGLEQRGFSVLCQHDGNFIYLRGDRNRLATLATLLTHTAVLVLGLGVVTSGVWGWREELALRPGEAVGVGAESGWSSQDLSQAQGKADLQVRNQGLTVLRYADGSVAGYDAEVVLIGREADAVSGHIRLNQPLVYRGIAFTLQSYAAHGQGHSITLRAVSDTGYHLVVIAGLLMFLGLTVSLSFPSSCIHVCIDPEGMLRLVGDADPRAWGFERQFTALVGEIGRWANQ